MTNALGSPPKKHHRTVRPKGRSTGRKPLDKIPENTTRICVAIDKKLLKQVDEKRNIKRSELVRNLLKQWLKK
jgi:hypothetical protein